MSSTTPTPPQPSVARMYDLYLGGDFATPTDRAAVEAVAKAMPDCFALCRENRSFLRRAVRYMISQGVTQFIDLGSGLPTQNNTHEVAQAAYPGAKVVYVDMDEAVRDLGTKLLAADGSTRIICADVRDPAAVLANPELRGLIDFRKPVGVLLMCVACFFTDAEIGSIMGTIRNALPAGSFIAATHDTFDGKRDEVETVRRVEEVYSQTPIPIYFRGKDSVARIFEELQLVEPGLVMLHEWHVELDDNAPEASNWLYGAVGRWDGGKAAPKRARSASVSSVGRVWKLASGLPRTLVSIAGYYVRSAYAHLKPVGNMKRF
ncbi:DUF574-domain-containing protein [Trichodelitschia bisporula]|uniref:DUF574-domain-containing protein n=1 Tax=Trichodelitschia bisporula TaxID=703511 RepID=A0A6G1HQV4_9PEZI|nr:DUF574-domain-containing protein [Trichodelitschia bisporula]